MYENHKSQKTKDLVIALEKFNINEFFDQPKIHLETIFMIGRMRPYSTQHSK